MIAFGLGGLALLSLAGAALAIRREQAAKALILEMHDAASRNYMAKLADLTAARDIAASDARRWQDIHEESARQFADWRLRESDAHHAELRRLQLALMQINHEYVTELTAPEDLPTHARVQ